MRRGYAALILASLLLSATFRSAQADCPVPAAYGTQPYPLDMAAIFDQAGANKLDVRGPAYPLIREGYPYYFEARATIPSVVLKSLGYIESGWRQYRVAWPPWGKEGFTLMNTSSDPYCAYGIMQIVSGMNCLADCAFEPQRVANDYSYNVGTGALILLRKWNYLASIGATIGDNSPRIVEDWYYAVWAYNGWAYYNNPNNPRYDPNRPPYDPSASYPAGGYPFQELVWGRAANPSSYGNVPLWPAISLTLPDRSLIPNDPEQTPEHIPDPQPTHIDAAPSRDLPYKQYFPWIRSGFLQAW